LDTASTGVFEPRTLVRRLLDVLHVAQEHVARLPEYRTYWADEEDPFITLADKIIVESAMLALVANRYACERAEVKLAVDALAGAVAPQARSSRNDILMRRYPHTAMSLGIAHAALESVGLRDPQFDALVREALAWEVDCKERLPYRAMERRWLKSLLEPNAQVEFDDLIPLSVAGQAPHPIFMLATDVYALTHVPMFITDFGHNQLPDGFPLAQYCEAVDASLAWTLFTDNFDLMAELVLARALLDVPWSSYSYMAWKTLELAWDQLGFLASPSLELKKFQELAPEERSSYAFRHVYHTTYVAGMLCAILLDPKRSLPSVVSPPLPQDSNLGVECESAFKAAMEFCASESDGYRLDLRALALHSRLGHVSSPLSAVREAVELWLSRNSTAVATPLRVHNNLQIPEVFIASILADGLLTCAARSYDLLMLAQVLRIVASLGLPLTATTCVASRFLIRQQLPSGAIGGWFLSSEHDGSVQAVEVTAGLALPLGGLWLRLSNSLPSAE
jgi:uncharacterized protein DUF6895